MVGCGEAWEDGGCAWSLHEELGSRYSLEKVKGGGECEGSRLLVLSNSAPAVGDVGAEKGPQHPCGKHVPKYHP